METYKQPTWKKVYSLTGYETDQDNTNIALEFAQRWAKGSEGGLNHVLARPLLLAGITITLPEIKNLLDSNEDLVIFKVYLKIQGTKTIYLAQEFKISGYDILVSPKYNVVRELSSDLITEA